MTADQRRMWLAWARTLDTLGAGPKVKQQTTATSAPVKRLSRAA